MAVARSMFDLRLEDREGHLEDSSLWLRQSGSHTRQHGVFDQQRTQTNTYVVQGGGEIFSAQFSGQDRFGVGVMFGYGNASSHTDSKLTGFYSKGQVDGYNAGLYATWYQDAQSLNGLYVDSWLQYNWLNASVNGEDLSQENYDINGVNASLESGYRIPVYQSANGNVFIAPQAQVIYSGMQADDHTETGGTQVQSSGTDNISTRLGVKISREGVSDQDKGSDKLFALYAEANWLYNSKLAGANMDGEQFDQTGTRNIGEVKLGLEGKLHRHFSLWTNVSQQLGDDGYSDTSGNIGFKYQF
jgi:autotransporter family porin